MKKSLLLFIVIFAGLTSCQYMKRDKKEVDMKREPIATVFEQTLYREDLNRVLPLNLSKEDSLHTADKYVKLWVSEVLMYEKARQNAVNQQTIDELVEAYRKSLVVNSYRERLLSEYFTKSITDQKLEEFYTENKDLMKLEEPIIKGLYLKIPKNSGELNNFKKWYKDTSDASVEKIEKNIHQNTVNYEYFYRRWVSFKDISNNIPQIITDKKKFLQTNKHIEVADSSFVYLLNIVEYKLDGDEAPYDYMKDRLPDMYREKYRVLYIKEIQKSIYDQALSKKQVTYYDK